MNKAILLLLLVVCAGAALFSQVNTVFSPEEEEELNPRIDKRFGISVKVGGAWGILGGLALDAFVIPELNVELNYLPIPILSSAQYYGGGITVHPLGGRKGLEFSPYIGIFYGHSEGETFISGAHEEYNALNVPVGIQFMGMNRRFGFCLEMGAAWTREYAASVPEGYRDEIYPTPSARIRFGF